MTQLILGTAQFGSGYGITNGARRITDDVIVELLAVATHGDISVIDTAVDYDDAQDRLRALLPEGSDFHFVSKFTLPGDGSEPDPAGLYDLSLRRLGASSLYGLLFHRIADLREARAGATLDILREARRDGVIERIGASIYDRDDLRVVLDAFPDLDLLQLPGSVIDQRLLDDPDVAELRTKGVEVHVRSAFLQGLVLADPDTLDERFTTLAPALRELHGLAESQETTVLELALRFLRMHPVPDAVLVGATTSTELENILRAWRASDDRPIEAKFDLPLEVVDPRRWNARA